MVKNSVDENSSVGSREHFALFLFWVGGSRGQKEADRHAGDRPRGRESSRGFTDSI